MFKLWTFSNENQKMVLDLAGIFGHATKLEQHELSSPSDVSTHPWRKYKIWHLYSTHPCLARLVKLYWTPILKSISDLKHGHAIRVKTKILSQVTMPSTSLNSSYPQNLWRITLLLSTFCQVPPQTWSQFLYFLLTLLYLPKNLQNLKILFKQALALFLKMLTLA